MDRRENPKTPSDFANEREAGDAAASVLPSRTGRENNMGAEPGTMTAGELSQPVGAQARSSVTGRHDSGSGANETADGLSETEEMVRISAEDVVPGDEDTDEPVFDRAEEIVRR